MARPSAPAKGFPTAESFDKAAKLVGHIGRNGIVNLKEDNTSISNESKPPRSLKAALEAVTNGSQSSSYASSEATSEEDYDSLKHDPLTVVRSGKGGGFSNGDGASSPAVNEERTYEEVKVPSKSRPKAPRLKSIPVTLNKMEEKGRYVLTADDEALREILRMGIERVHITFSEFQFRKILTYHRKKILLQTKDGISFET